MRMLEMTDDDLEGAELVETATYSSISGTFLCQEIERRAYWRLPDGRFVIQESFAYEDEDPVKTYYYEASENEFFADMEWNCFERCG